MEQGLWDAKLVVVKDERTQARLSAAIENLNDRLEVREPATRRATPEPSVDVDAIRRSVVLAPGSPYRRAMDRKREHLAREDGRLRHQELSRDDTP